MKFYNRLKEAIRDTLKIFRKKEKSFQRMEEFNI